MEPLVYIFLMIVGWGLNGVLIKKGLMKFDALKGTFITLLIPAPMFFIICLVNGDYKELFSINTYTLAFFALSGLSNVAGRIMAFTAIKMVGAARAYPISSTEIVFSVTFAILFLGEAFTWYLAACVFVLILGVSLVSASREPQVALNLETNFLKGIFIALCSAISWGAGFIFTKIGLLNLDSPMLGAFLAFSVGTLGFGLSLGVTGRNRGLCTVDASSLKFLLVAGFVMTVGMYAYFMALSILPVTFVVTTTRVYPLITVLLSYLFIQKVELVNLRVVLGAALIVLGTSMAASQI